MTIKEYFEFSQLSQAAYALFTSDVTPGAVQNALIAVDTGDFTTKQAEAFTDADTGYTLIPNSHQPDDTAGFSASLFQSNETGEITLAIRGTAGLTDLLQDAKLATRGYADDQIYSLYNYVQRLITPAGQTVSQWIPINEGGGVYYQKTSSAQGLGLIPVGTRINVTGHSLGGHLALAFSRLFPDLVDEVYTFNAPGFKNNAEVNNFFASLGGVATFPSDRITNINADARAEIIAGLHQLPGPPSQNIFIEDQGLGIPGNHSSVVLTDSLAVYDIFATLDPDADVSTITGILKAASNKNSNSLETTLDALRTFFQENYALGTPDTNATPTTIDNRDSFYANLFSLQGYIENLPFYDSNTKSLGLSVDSLVDQGATSLFNTAQTDIATRYALYKLNPFVINNAGDLYSAINNSSDALDLYKPATSTGSLTEQYFQDRAAFLTSKLWSGTNDRRTESQDAALFVRSGAPAYFEDRSGNTPYKLYQGLAPAVSGISTATMSQYLFGGANADSLTGGNKADSLYGMAGNDSLQGKLGNDYLEGGAGDDTYIYTSNDGTDTILDTDGLGQITFDGAILNGGDKLIGDTYQSADKNYFYTLLHNTGEQDSLLINAKGGTILIKDFQSDELGRTPVPVQQIHRDLNCIHLTV